MRPTVIAVLIILLAISVVLLVLWPSVITALFLIFGGSGVLAWHTERQRRKSKRSRFSDREHVPVEKLVDDLAGDVDSRERCVYWWNKAASLLEIDATLLRPTDRFDVELAPVPGSMTVDELSELDYLIDEMGLAEEYERLTPKPGTLGEYVRFLATATPSEHSARKDH